ncbi:MAG: acetyl esterase [Candidatus Azotimanducaceae bacterium]|jgi:acetyl esterase
MSESMNPSINPRELPGRLGNPESTLLTDKRADPRIVAALEAMGGMADGVETPAPGASYEECLAYCQAFEAAMAEVHPMMVAAMPEYPNVVSRSETIKGVDGNDITLYIHAPAAASETPRPCILHTHGGGMVLMTAADPTFVRWRNDLAAAGMVVVGVEFRNGGGALGNHPFPAGLNDCFRALQWTHENKTALGISHIVVSGESGGGNLAIATTLKAKQEGCVDLVGGVYAACPYISGAYADPPANLLSLEENNGYSMDCEIMAAMVTVYDPENLHATNPLAWPYHATREDLKGLPPHVISVNELDPLRDEGLEFFRQLLAAGTSAVARTVHGTHHAGDLGLPDVIPDTYRETLRSICGFAESL